MDLILVHWLIKKGRELDFEKHWEKMSVEGEKGLFREILTTINKNTFDPKFQTFSIENPNYTTYINIGMWASLADFDNAIEKYFPKASSVKTETKTVQTIELEDFEFKVRERLILRKVRDRGSALPEADIKE